MKSVRHNVEIDAMGRQALSDTISFLRRYIEAVTMGRQGKTVENCFGVADVNKARR